MTDTTTSEFSFYDIVLLAERIKSELAYVHLLSELLSGEIDVYTLRKAAQSVSSASGHAIRVYSQLNDVEARIRDQITKQINQVSPDSDQF